MMGIISPGIAERRSQIQYSTVKATAAIAGFLPAAFYLLRVREWDRASVKRTFQSLAVLGATALTAAAFLRWFS